VLVLLAQLQELGQVEKLEVLVLLAQLQELGQVEKQKFVHCEEKTWNSSLQQK
jgi:hypothetical protein